MEVRTLRTIDSIGLRVGMVSFWMGFGIDVNVLLRPIMEIAVKRMSGFNFAITYKHKAVVRFGKWFEVK